MLAYKARKGRTLDSRKQALGRLVELIDGLATRPGLPPLTTAGRCAQLHAEIAAATTGAALRRLEDPIDAILCAYVVLLFLAGRTAIIGDGESGAIVTPMQERHRRLLGLPLCAAHAADPAAADWQICSGHPGSP